MNKIISIKSLICGLLIGISTVGFSSTVQQVGRYASVSIEPTQAQINPLKAVASFKFKHNVVTVGDAIQQVLSTTGYSLVSTSKMDDFTLQTMNKPIPMVDRELGPMETQEVLLILMGKKTFDMQVDFVHRLVNFQLKPEFKKIYADGEKS